MPQETQPVAQAAISVKEFFETVPPGRDVLVKELVKEQYGSSGVRYYSVILPLLELHCGTDSCSGVRFFESSDEIYPKHSEYKMEFVTFVCRNCNRSRKLYSVSILLQADKSSGSMFKFGEVPAFGPPTPAKLISLIGPEKEYFLKGRRAENQGLGIAAFAYYRRVVETQKNRILDEIIRVASKIGASAEMLKDLSNAKNEDQFGKAVAAVKHGIPPALMVKRT
jgi:hypothetical protein